MTLLISLLPVYAAYFLGTVSPGPSNLAIMGLAMRQGRLPALSMAAGVITGSLFWALIVATGISSLLLAYTHALIAIKLAGGCYLLYIACKAVKGARRKGEAEMPANEISALVPLRKYYQRGLLLHLANPKAILVWLAIISLGVHADASPWILPLIIGGCACIGVVVFSSYALLFSTRTLSHAYLKSRRAIEGFFALFFGIAGIKLLLSR